MNYLTLFTPLLVKALRVLIGKNVPSLARWAQTALGAWLVTLGLMDPATAENGFTLGELVMSLGGVFLVLESRFNNWWRGRNLYGVNLSPLGSVIGRSGLSLVRAVLNMLSAWLVTVGAFDMEPAALEALPFDAVITGIVGMLVTRLMSWAEAWLKGELPEQLAEDRAARAFASVDGI
jgi:hypothetical protein